MDTLIARFHLHPVIDHFTIALLGVGILADLLASGLAVGARGDRLRMWHDRLKATALELIALGALAAVFSHFTGEQEAQRLWDSMSPAAQDLLWSDRGWGRWLSHAVLGTYLMYACVALALWRVMQALSPSVERTRVVYLPLALLAAGALLYQGKTGGELVYEHGVGITSSRSNQHGAALPPPPKLTSAQPSGRSQEAGTAAGWAAKIAARFGKEAIIMELGLKDRVALVTGSSRGIGRATAELLGREGARVAVTYHNLRERGEAVAAGIRERGGDAFAIQLDISSDQSIRAAVEATAARWGRIDVLINNAIHGGERAVVQSLFEQVPAEQWRDLLRGNFEGAHVAIGAVLPYMRRQQWGRIVNVSSVVAADGFPGGATYGAAKAALHGLTKTLARELAPVGILTNVVMPGLTLTEAVRHSMAGAVEQAAKSSPIRHVPTSEEVAQVIVFVASAANTVINGEVIRANGGAIA